MTAGGLYTLVKPLSYFRTNFLRVVKHKDWGGNCFSKGTHALERAFLKMDDFLRCFNHYMICIKKLILVSNLQAQICEVKKNLETDFLQLFQNLPNELIKCFIDPFVKNLKSVN